MTGVLITLAILAYMLVGVVAGAYWSHIVHKIFKHSSYEGQPFYSCDGVPCVFPCGGFLGLVWPVSFPLMFVAKVLVQATLFAWFIGGKLASLGTKAAKV